MKTIFLIMLAMAAGSLLPLQMAFNAQLGNILKHPFLASMTNFIIAALSMLLVLLIVRPELPAAKTFIAIPPYLYTGGLIGATFITIALILTPKIGATNTLMAAVVGQLLISVIIDHFGMFGLPELHISLPRVAGAVFLLTGLYLIQYRAN